MNTLWWIGGVVLILGVIVFGLLTVTHFAGDLWTASRALASHPLGEHAVAEPHHAGLIMTAGAALMLLAERGGEWGSPISW